MIYFGMCHEVLVVFMHNIDAYVTNRIEVLVPRVNVSATSTLEEEL